MVDDAAASVLTAAQAQQVLALALPGAAAQLTAIEARPAGAGLAGFLGDHARITLQAHVPALHRVHLFVKSLPRGNPAKAAFIDEGNYFRREALAYQLFEEMGGDEGPQRWRATAYIHSESLLVMPDLAAQGYRSCLYSDTLDLPHALLAAAAVARFHAAFCNLATARGAAAGRPYRLLEEHARVLGEPTFCDSPWVRAAAKLSADFVEAFSDRYRGTIPHLEPRLAQLYVQACDSLREYEGTLNVMVHKDLWVNNILFRYDASGAPAGALLLDFQCVRSAPPAFDLMVLLCLTTSREFRARHERDVLRHYRGAFEAALDAATARRLRGADEPAAWCEHARMFALFMAVGIFPYVLMEPRAAARCFDDPGTYERYTHVDRSAPVLQHVRTHEPYRVRQLHATEEFLERYVVAAQP